MQITNGDTLDLALNKRKFIRKDWQDNECNYVEYTRKLSCNFIICFDLSSHKISKNKQFSISLGIDKEFELIVIENIEELDSLIKILDK